MDIRRGETMKLSFSTLGCPRWDMKEIVATAKDLGYDGVELRGVQSELRLTRHNAFLPENIMATRGDVRIPFARYSLYYVRLRGERSYRKGKLR